MKKFLNGEREFAKDQIVYFIEQDGAKLKLSFGKVDKYFGGGVFYVLVYSYPYLKDENDVIFLGRFTNVDLTDTPAIEDSISNGVLIEGVMRRFDRSEYLNLGISAYKDDIFTDYTLAKQELGNRIKSNQEKLEFITQMSEYDYTLYEVERTIKYLTEESKSTVRKLLPSIDVLNIYSTTILDGKFKYKYFNKTEYQIDRLHNAPFNPHGQGEYIDLCQVEYEKTDYDKRKEIEDTFPEHYLVTVTKLYDEDRHLFVREFTNDSPDVIFEKYGKDPENILEIVNRKWSIEDGLKTPVGYRDGYDNGKEILITDYKFNRGTFDLRNGEIGEVNIYLDSTHGVDNQGFHIFSDRKSSLSQTELEKKFQGLLTKVVGNYFGNLIYEKMIRE